MFEYEELLVKSFPKLGQHLTKCEQPLDDLESCKQKAVRFLEMKYSTTFGFPAEIHFFNKEETNIDMIPVVFDTAFILGILCSVKSINATLINTLIQVVVKSRKSSGFWNHFLNVDDNCSNLLPDDIDDTSVCLMGLYITGNISAAECRETALKMIDNLIFDTDQRISAWLQDNDNKVLYKSLLHKARVDIGSIANFLWFFSSFGLDTHHKVIPTVQFMGQFIDELDKTQESQKELEGMVYYTNRPILYFLLSSYISKSSYAKDKFGEKFAKLLQKEIVSFEVHEDKQALDMAALVLAATTLGLHNVDEQPWIKCSVEVSKIQTILIKMVNRFPSLQNNNGSFPAWNVYNWFKVGEYGGSASFTTAMVLSAINSFDNEINNNCKIN